MISLFVFDVSSGSKEYLKKPTSKRLKGKRREIFDPRPSLKHSRLPRCFHVFVFVSLLDISILQFSPLSLHPLHFIREIKVRLIKVVHSHISVLCTRSVTGSLRVDGNLYIRSKQA